MKEHHSKHMHPHHKGHHAGGGMPYFEKEHWQKPAGEVSYADTKYGGGDFGQAEDYKKSVDAQAHYARKHKEPH